MQYHKTIANITARENNNLKEQNAYLLAKLRSLQNKQTTLKVKYESQVQYKLLYESALEDIQNLKHACEAYRDKAESMKLIALRDVKQLENNLANVLK